MVGKFPIFNLQQKISDRFPYPDGIDTWTT